MPKFLITVQGRLLSDAQDSNTAKESMAEFLKEKYPWLKVVTYGEAEQVTAELYDGEVTTTPETVEV